MKIRTAGRNVLTVAFIAASLLGAAPASPQVRRAPIGIEQERRVPIEEAVPIKGSCPRPIAVTLNATTPNVFNADFNAGMLALPRAFLNDPSPDKRFVYTFQWTSEQRCCEITDARLTVRLKANLPGQSYTDHVAGNDGIAIVHLGSTVPPFNGAVYTPPNAPPFSAGQTAIKTWTLTGAALNNLKANHRLSIYVQDDTMVESATLQIYGCCLSSPRKDSVEEAQPSVREN